MYFKNKNLYKRSHEIKKEYILILLKKGKMKENKTDNHFHFILFTSLVVNILRCTGSILVRRFIFHSQVKK